MRRGILSSLPDDDYLSIALLHCTFNVYATICRATDRQGFLNVRRSWLSAVNDKVSTDFVGFGDGFVGLGCPWALVHFAGSFR
ncbi:membrane-associated PAP2 superfamily phosphatase [Caballeronia udeis]|uniref:Membrane-associated PAP2 superfamily phosphatase n=1 Tax=Caballeronia udeis TaxID=1232866 RepID=A0ABW8M8Q4_9BURK